MTAEKLTIGFFLLCQPGIAQWVELTMGQFTNSVACRMEQSLTRRKWF